MLPVRAKGKPRKQIDMTVLLLHDAQRVVLHKRPDTGLLAGMYEFYQIEGRLDADAVAQHVKDLGFEVLGIGDSIAAKHVFSHLEWHMTGYAVHVASTDPTPAHLCAATFDEVGGVYPVPSAHKAYKVYLEQIRTKE